MRAKRKVLERLARNCAFTFVLAVVVHVASYGQTNLEQPWGNCFNGDVWIAVDISGSIKGHETNISKAIEVLASRIINSHSSARVGLVYFTTDLLLNPQTNLQVDLTREIKPFQNLELSTKFDEDIGVSLLSIAKKHYAVTTKTQRESPGYRQVIILISDGEYDGDEGKKDKTIELTKTVKNDFGMDIFSIHVFDETTKEEDTELLKAVSGERYMGRGPLYFSSDLSGLPEFFRMEFTCV